MSTHKKTISWYNGHAGEYSLHLKDEQASVYHKLYEKPTMHHLLPDLKKKKILLLGCGNGEESGYFTELGASHIVGIDISEKLIEIAKLHYQNCKFHVMDMEKLKFPDRSFDFVYSSLAIDYLKNWFKTLDRVHRVLKSNGMFLFSCTHPISTAMETFHCSGNNKMKQLAVIKNKKTKKVKIIGSYVDTHEIVNPDGGSVMWHRSLGEMVKEIRQSGFFIENIVEPKPLIAMKKISPGDFVRLSKIPHFIVFMLRKK